VNGLPNGIGSPLPWSGSIAFGPNWLLYNGAIGPTGAHARHADQVIVSADTEQVEVDADGRLLAGTVIRIPSDGRHSIRRGTAIADVLFVEPTHRFQPPDGGPKELGPPRPITDWVPAVKRVTEILWQITPTDQLAGAAHPAVELALSRQPDLVADGPVSASNQAGGRTKTATTQPQPQHLTHFEHRKLPE